MPPDATADAAARLASVAGDICVYGFPRWKWRFVRRCLAGQRVRFAPQGAPAPTQGVLLLWGMAPPPPGLPASVPVLRMEDGFLRSVGLGAELTRPLSWVVDQSGIYYDATRPSDLEYLLAQGDFPPALLARAAALRQGVVAAGLTKYNLHGQPWRRPPTARRVILVPGQVESDASLAFGAPQLRTNMGLLQAVRAARPDAYLIYKPHPDVVARLRLAGEADSQAAAWCDEVVTDVSMSALLDAVNEVHVLTSLAGFEALLRGRSVTCWGLPFYAGWGLTEDHLNCPRRGRTRTLDELIAATLLLYPLYFGPRGLVTPETSLAALSQWKQRESGRPRPFQGIYRFFLRRFIGIR